MPVHAPAPARRKADPRNDPRFRAAVDKVAEGSARLKQHPPAARKAQEPAKAAKGPPDEKAAGARAKQVDKLEKVETPRPQTASFLAILQAEIARAMPKTLGDTEKFMQGGSSQALKGSLKGNVDQQKQASTADLKQTSGQTPSEAGVPAKPVIPIPPEPAPPAPQVDGASAMPAPRPAAEVSLEASKHDVAAQMREEKLTDERLRKANDPRFSAVIGSRDAVNRHAAAGPVRYRAAEAATLGRAAGLAAGVAGRGVSTLLAVKRGSKAKVLSRQEQKKQKEEQELRTFTGFVSSTFQTAKKAVEKRLEVLETRVNDLFDRGVDAALASMKKFVEDQLYQYKLNRYLLQVGGALLWIRDQFMDLPPEVNRFYTAGRERFTREMNALAVRVADLVESQLSAAKNDVKQAQAKIASAQKALSPAVQARATAAVAEYAGQFAELESGIEDKKQQLAEGLAQKYREAFDKADESLKAIQDENRGLVTKAKEAIGEVLKALAEFKARLMGILRKGAGAMDLILADPIQFLSNLISAIKLGFSRFSDNITKHLEAGFLKWLFGSLGKLGIEIPRDLSLPSVLQLVLGVLGITYARMREKAVRLIGARAVGAVEKVVEAIGVLIKGGPAALWEQVKEGLSNLKEMVIDAMQEWLITTIVKKATAKIVSLFNPVGAIIAAVMLIVDVVTFVVTKAAQILDFVEAVVSSIAAIASGAVGAAAAWIEKSLANMIPLLIGFLASLLGLSGVTEKIKELIKKVQSRVDKAIDKVIAKIVAGVKKLFGKKGSGAQKDVVRIKFATPFDMHGEGHQVFAETRDGQFVLEMASGQRQKLLALTLRAKSETTNERAKKRLANVYSKLKLAEDKVRYLISDRDKDDEALAEAKKLTADAANQLRSIGVDFDIPSLNVIPHRSEYVQTVAGGYAIKAKYAHRIRATFYPAGYEPATRQWKRDFLQNHTDPVNRKNFIDAQGRSEPKTQATIDHQPRVVEHWQQSGKQIKQSARAAWYTDHTGGHLSVVARKYNSSDGAEARRQGLSYSAEGVGKDFGGPGEG